MRRSRSLTWSFLASSLALVTAGFVTGGPPVPTASAAVADRWLEVEPSCCGDSGAYVALAGDWPAGVDAVLEVDRLPLGSVDVTMTQTTPTSFSLGAPLGGGDVVRVTVDGTTREVVIEPISVEWILSDLDLAVGTALDGWIEVTANPGSDPVTQLVPVTAGLWTADFSGLFDIQEQDPSAPAPPAAMVSARMREQGPTADGDVLIHGRTANTPVVNVLPNCCGNQAVVQTSGWRIGTVLTLDVLRGTDTVLHKVVLGFTGFPQLTDNNELAPLLLGDVVRVSAFGLTKEVMVVPMTIATVDTTNDTATGTAPAGATVEVTVIVPGTPGPSPATVTTTADGSGLWAATFAPGFDLLSTHQVNARVVDPERDSVAALYFPPPPTPWLTPSPDTGLTDGQTVALTGGNWPAGKTLYVRQCRTGVSLSPDICDTTTTQTFTVGPSGTVSGDFTVAAQLDLTYGPWDCEFGCGLVGVVWQGAPGVGFPQAMDVPDNNPLSFVSATRIVTVTPDSGLQHGQTVQVHGEGYSPDDSVFVTQCRNDDPASERLCERPPVYVDPQSWDDVAGVWVTPEADGTFDVDYVVKATLPTWTADVTVDLTWIPTTENCLETGACAIVAWRFDAELTRIGVPITFAPWPDTGFEGTTLAPPAVNVVKAGSVVTVTFTVGGNRGLDVVAAGYPQSTQIACGTTPDETTGDPTQHQGKKALTYDKRHDQYTYKWDTEKAWKGTCRQLIIQLADGTYLQADFRFR